MDYLAKKTNVNNGEIPQYYVEGDHEAIIDPAVFDRVQIELEKRCSGKNRHSGVHDFSGKIKCGECGSWYGSKVWHSTDKYRKVIWRCNHKYGGEKCSTPHLTDDEIKAAFVSAANRVLADKDTVIETFRLIRDSVFDTSALEQERTELTDELNVVARLIQDGIYQNAHVAQNQADYRTTTRNTKASPPGMKRQRAALTRWRQKFTTRIPAASPSSITLPFWKNARMPSRSTTLPSGTAWWNS